MARKKKKDRIPKELILLLLGGGAVVAAGVYIMTRPKTAQAAPPQLAPRTPINQINPLPPPPPGSYNAALTPESLIVR